MIDWSVSRPETGPVNKHKYGSSGASALLTFPCQVLTPHYMTRRPRPALLQSSWVLLLSCQPLGDAAPPLSSPVVGCVSAAAFDTPQRQSRAPLPLIECGPSLYVQFELVR